MKIALALFCKSESIIRRQSRGVPYIKCSLIIGQLEPSHDARVNYHLLLEGLIVAVPDWAPGHENKPRLADTRQ